MFLSPDEQPGAASVPLPGRPPLAPRAVPAQPASPRALGLDAAAALALAACGARVPSLSSYAVLASSLEARTGCVKCARPGPRGGRGVNPRPYRDWPSAHSWSSSAKLRLRRVWFLLEMFGFPVRQGGWRCLAGEGPVRVGRSWRPVVSVAQSPATAGVKRTQQSRGVGY